MTKIGLLSDTHGFIDNKIIEFFTGCDEIWHAGDIGTVEVINKLSVNKTIRAVFGNIDGAEIRIRYKQLLRFSCEGAEVLMTHIGGSPGHYAKELKNEMALKPPKIFICGHSHILKVMYDKKFDLLFINPGAAGISGFHKVRTAIRFQMHASEPKQMEILEIDRN
jgi:uncharacterized protein